MMKQSKTSTGYWKIELKKDGVRKSIKVHRLVGQAFISNPENKPMINHLDCNPLNNHVDNLEWCTQKENMQYAVSLNRTKRVRNKVNYDEVIKMYKETKSANKVSKECGFSDTLLVAILRERGIKPFTISEANNKYNIDLDKLAVDFRSGMKNAELVKKYKCSKDIIATRRYRMKKEGVI